MALASGQGRSPRAIVRLSGSRVSAVARRVFERLPEQPGAHAGVLKLGSGQRLPVLAARYAKGRSFTGEDALEVLVPGNPVLIDRVIRMMLDVPGVREAEPGEFSARAYLAGRLTLTQAEGVAAIIAAGTEDELAAARQLLAGGGALGARFERWADELATLLALVEAGIDFTDQEGVAPIAPEELTLRLARLADDLTQALGSARGSESATWLPVVVLAGSPNAGKSTLFNALLGRARAVTSPIAGTTRDVLRESLTLSRQPLSAFGRDDLAVELVDLAGLEPGDSMAAERCAGAPTNEIDAAASMQARAAIADADVVLWCDPLGRFEARDRPVMRPGAALLKITAKADLLSMQARASAANAPTMDAPNEPLPVCAIDGFGLDALRQRIIEAAWSGTVGAVDSAPVPGAGARTWLLPRHRRALLRALHALREAREAAGRDSHPSLCHVELVANRLRSALDHVGELVGRVDPDQVLGRVFATFCIGK